MIYDISRNAFIDLDIRNQDDLANGYITQDFVTYTMGPLGYSTACGSERCGRSKELQGCDSASRNFGQGMKIFKKKCTVLDESKEKSRCIPYCKRCVPLDLDGVLLRWLELDKEVVTWSRKH